MKGKASAHEALVQVAEVTVHRDLNKDFKRTNDKTDTGLFGINQHWGYDAPKDDLGNTSAGCLVGPDKEGTPRVHGPGQIRPALPGQPVLQVHDCGAPGRRGARRHLTRRQGSLGKHRSAFPIQLSNTVYSLNRFQDLEDWWSGSHPGYILDP